MVYGLPLGWAANAEEQQIAGYLFGTPVPASNYWFAKRVAHQFPRPGEEGLSEADRERNIWEALILHYEATRRGVSVSEAELDSRIQEVLRSEGRSFTRHDDPAAYERWVRETLNEPVELFENQMRYLLMIDTLKDQVRQSAAVEVTEEEMQQEFLNEQHHIGGEMVTFKTKEDAESFYAGMKEPAQWEVMKAGGEPAVRPVSLMTLEAYHDLWGAPLEPLYAFHAMALGSIGPPMPFGKEWCVYRLLDKRTGALEDFPAQRDAYKRQLTARKQYETLKRWVEDLKASANLRVLPLEGDR
jgi:hypothetical protein